LIQKRGKIVPSLCYLCKGAKEDKGHLMIGCPYASQIWKDVEKMAGISNVWNGASIEECSEKWFKKELKVFRALPCLVCNDNILNENQKPSFQVCSQVYGLFQSCKMEVKEKVPRQIGELLIEKSYPWGFLDGAKQWPQDFYSAGVILYFSNSHFIKFKVGLGTGMNISVELFALRSLLKLAIEKGIDKMQVFGDSLLVINWMRGDSQIQNVTLGPLSRSIENSLRAKSIYYIDSYIQRMLMFKPLL
jgi:ribonuclease HI